MIERRLNPASHALFLKGHERIACDDTHVFSKTIFVTRSFILGRNLTAKKTPENPFRKFFIHGETKLDGLWSTD